MPKAKKSTTTTKMDPVTSSISTLLVEHLEAIVVDEKSVGQHLSSIKKQMKIISLNQGLDNLNLDAARAPSDNNVEEIFRTCLIGIIDQCMATEQYSEAMDRAWQLVAALIVDEKDTASVGVPRVVEFSSVLLERVRAHACRLLGYIGNFLCRKKDQTEWALETYNDVLASLEPRMKDKSQSVRLQAIRSAGMSLEGLSSDEDCPLLESLFWSLWHDPSVTNRVEAVNNLPLAVDASIDHLCARIRDEKEKVRVAALGRLADAEFPGSFSSDQVAQIVRAGLMSRCTATTRAAICLVSTSWMPKCSFKAIRLLGAINIQENEEEAEKLIQEIVNFCFSGNSDGIVPSTLFNQMKDGVEASLPFIETTETDLSPEQIFFARVYMDFLLGTADVSDDEKDRVLSKVVPSLPVLIDILEAKGTGLMQSMANYSSSQEEEQTEVFLCMELIRLAKSTKFVEEGSRRQFVSAMSRALGAVQTPEDIIEVCYEALASAHKDEAMLVDSINGIVDSLTLAMGEGGDDEALKISCRLRILSVAGIALERCSSKLSNTPLLPRLADHIIPAVTDDNALIREAGVVCFGKLGLFSNPSVVCEEFRPLLLNVANNEDESKAIRGQAILSLCDWLMLFGDSLEPGEGGPSETSSVVGTVHVATKHSSRFIATVGAEVAAKLLFNERMYDNSVLAHLVVLFFDESLVDADNENDATEIGNPERLKQILSFFLPAYGIKSTKTRDSLVSCVGEMLKQAMELNSSRGKKKASSLSLVKMVEYVHSIASDATEAVSSQSSPDANQEPVENMERVRKSALGVVMALHVTKFLLVSSDAVNVTTLRGLCKFVGRQEVDLQRDEIHHLSALQEALEELGSILHDEKALELLEDLSDDLAGFEPPSNDFDDAETISEASTASQRDNGDSETETEDEEDLVEGLTMMTLAGKENRDSVKSIDSNRLSAANASAPLSSVN